MSVKITKDGEEYIAHAALWKNHKYVQKIGNRYIYPEDLAGLGQKPGPTAQQNRVQATGGNAYKTGAVYGSYNPTNMKKQTVGAPGGGQSILQKKASGASTSKKQTVGAPKGNTPILKQGPDYFRQHTSADTSKKTSSGTVGAPGGGQSILQKKASGASTPMKKKTVGAPGGGQSILQKKASGASTPKKQTVGAPKGNTPILKQGPDYFRQHTSAGTSKKTSSGTVGAPGGGQSILQKKASGASTPKKQKTVGAPGGGQSILQKKASGASTPKKQTVGAPKGNTPILNKYLPGNAQQARIQSQTPEKKPAKEPYKIQKATGEDYADVLKRKNAQKSLDARNQQHAETRAKQTSKQTSKAKKILNSVKSRVSNVLSKLKIKKKK